MTPENQHFDRKSLRKVTDLAPGRPAPIDIYCQLDKLSASK